MHGKFKRSAPQNDEREGSRPVTANDLVELFGLNPLVKGEDPKAYTKIVMLMLENVRPTDVIEKMLVRDIADHTWEVLRLRRYKSAMINTAIDEARMDRLSELKDFTDKNDPQVRALVKEEKSKDPVELASRAFLHKSVGYEVADNLMSRAEHRRVAALNIIEARRDLIERRARETASRLIQTFDKIGRVESDLEVEEALTDARNPS